MGLTPSCAIEDDGMYGTERMRRKDGPAKIGSTSTQFSYVEWLWDPSVQKAGKKWRWAQGGDKQSKLDGASALKVDAATKREGGGVCRASKGREGAGGNFTSGARKIDILRKKRTERYDFVSPANW